MHRRQYLATLGGVSVGLPGCLGDGSTTSYEYEIRSFSVPDTVPPESGFDFEYELHYDGESDGIYRATHVSRPKGASAWTWTDETHVEFFGPGQKNAYMGVPFLHETPGVYEATVVSDQSKNPDLQTYEVVRETA